MTYKLARFMNAKNADLAHLLLIGKNKNSKNIKIILVNIKPFDTLKT